MTIESQRKRQIVEAARACIKEEGVERLTLRKVAEKAQVSHATIVYYFNTRRELIDSALLEISEDFMVGLRQRQLIYGTQDLIDLVHTFLDPENPSARFVVQMIDSGLHDAYLRDTHDMFVSYGRERIEKSLRAGMDAGELRRDIDPVVAAGLLHTVLIFWQSELAAGATTREKALEVGELALTLLAKSNETRNGSNGNRNLGRGLSTNGARKSWTPQASPLEVIEASLMDDPTISAETANALAQAFKQIYQLAVGATVAAPPQPR
jgi:AcrR family transcriptional regulator